MPPLSFRSIVLSIVGAVSCAGAIAAPPPPKEIGNYELFFVVNIVGELVLVAHVTDSQGAVATDGVVVFEYCSLGGRANDITQPDEASLSACADGSGRWRRLDRALITANGNASLFFGLVQVVPVIGFRYTYSQGSVVADWVTEPVDWFR
jgi:hypothetical protein